MKILVISGINLFEGGPLSIYYDCLDEICNQNLEKKYHIILFVHKKELFERYADIVEIIELPKSKKSYLYRLYYEYIFFYRFSKQINIDVWISLHDITPRVKAERIYTYCHNPSPFMKKDLSKVKYSVKNVAFSFFYRYLYRINIKSANAVIVQQNWMRKKFLQMYPINNVIVAKPNIDNSYIFKERKVIEKKIFIYAAYPRFFKNYEVIFDACELLDAKKIEGYEVWVTIDGTENNYSKDLKNRYSHLMNIKWLGLLKRERVFEKYEESDCLIFPSVLETWGLPISEYKSTGKEMLLSDLEYAYETLGKYNKARFFDPNEPYELMQCMKNVIEGKQIYDETNEKEIEQPYAKDWEELIRLIL